MSGKVEKGQLPTKESVWTGAESLGYGAWVEYFKDGSFIYHSQPGEMADGVMDMRDWGLRWLDEMDYGTKTEGELDPNCCSDCYKKYMAEND